MRITYISDLHVDILKDPTLNLPNKDQYDLCIVAGDIANHAKECVRYMNKFKKKLINNKRLIYVPGNHCRWSLSFAKSELILSKFPDFMNRSIRVINGQRFLGLTLWYGLQEEDSRKTWSDFRAIEDWRTIQQEHDLDLEFLNKNLQEGDIVVSHMLPSFDCVSGEYIGNHYNRFYISDVDSLIKERKPKAWFMGHSHEFLYRKIHDTIFLRNPLGYPSEYGKFNGFFIFDTDKLELTHSDVKE